MPKSAINIRALTGFLEESIVEATGNKNRKFLYNLWDEVVPATPVQTGLAMFSWRMVPSQKSTYKPKMTSDLIFSESVGRGTVLETRIFPEPERPNLEKYRRIYKKFVLFNNQDYITQLNENENKYYYQFINDGIKRAIKKTEISDK